MSLFAELNRRNVLRVAIAYIVASWVILQASALLLDVFDAPDSVMRVIVVLLVLGFILSISFTWAFEVTPDGIKRESGIDHGRPVTQQTARRLDLLTIALVIVAISVLALDRIMQSEPASTADGVANANRSDHAITRLAQEILRVDQLRDAGEYSAAFALASEIESLVQDESVREALWADISWTTDIESEPPGAQVFRQPLDAAEDNWVHLGATPLTGVRFALDVGYRLRFELAGHRPVELLQSAVRDFRWGETTIDSGPVKLDANDILPEEMVRIPGFTRDLVDYADFFMNRYEVTNREFARFVASGGYNSPQHWQHPFMKDGMELSFDDAMAYFVDRTGRRGPATWTGGTYPDGKDNYPVSGVSWYEAAAYASFVDKQLPTFAHIDAARKYYLVDSGLILSRSNFGSDGPWPVGFNRAMNTLGIYDLDGNVREWCWNEAGPNARGTMGSGWTDARFHAFWRIPKPSWDRDPTNGIRLIRTFDSREKLARLRQPEVPPPQRNLFDEPMPSEEEVSIYRRMFAYDAFPLNAKTVKVDKFEYWDRIHVEFDVPYGERGGAYLYVPADTSPPYEAVIYWGGGNVLDTQSVDREFIEGFNFIVRSGRVVAQPILKGTFDRRNESTKRAMDKIDSNPNLDTGTAWRDFVLMWVQDISRTIDYLDSRDDINSKHYGFYGLSWGAGIAPIALALEDRIGPAVLNVGGLDSHRRDLPEVAPLTYVRFVRNPVLMLNGEYDPGRPLETSQKPLFELLGTDPAHKKHLVTPAGHVVPREVTVRETLDWFDRYLRGNGD